MPTFQFKDPKYVLSPPQHGTKAIVNDLTVDASYKQVIDDLPITSSTNLESIDFRAIAVLTLLISAGVTGGISNAFIRLLDVELDGTKALDITDSGTITAGAAGTWLSFSRNTASRTLREKQHAEKLVAYLEQFYEQYKDESVTYQGAEYKIYLSEPKNNTGDFDSQRHYIVADASERVDRLKLIKYNSKPSFNHSYWFDAGTGAETEGLDSLPFTGSKTANSSKITGKNIKFDGSDSNVVNTSTNTFTIEDHGFVTGDSVEYFKDIHLNFDSSDTSVVSVANNTITLADHGFRTGDALTYIVKPGDVPIAPFNNGSSELWVLRVDDDTFKLRDEDDNVIDITGVGLGIHSFSVASVQFTSDNYRHRSSFKVIRTSDDEFKLSLDGITALSIDAVGVGTEHYFRSGYETTLTKNQFISVSESVNFSGSSSGVNVATNVITTTGAHGYTTGDTTVYTRGGSASIGGLVHKRLYYVIVESSTTLKLAASAKDAEDGTAVNLTAVDPGAEPDHKLTTEYGSTIYRLDDQNIYTSTSDEVVFTNRTLKTPNWVLDPKVDIMVAKVYKYRTGATIKTTEAVATTTHNLKNITGERFRVGATITQGINGSPKILSAVFTENADLGEDALITIDSAQTAAVDDAVVIESFAQEAYYNLESGDRLQEDDAPKLSAQLDLNSQSISDGTVSVSSFVNAAAGVSSNDNDTSIPTTAAVKAYADSVAGGGTVDTSGTPEANQYARFTDADTLQGRTAAQVLADIGAQASLTFGIANDNAVEIDDADVADNDYAKFTANGLEGRNASEVKTDLSLNNVENTAISTFAGSANITTVGTVSTGTWQGTAIADGYISSASTWNAKQDALTFGIANDNAVEIDDADAASGNYARFTANGIEGRTNSDVLSDIGAQASLTFGIANDNAVEIDDADVTSGDYARFTANGLEGRSNAEVASDIGAMSTAVDNLMATDKKIQFRDTGQFIHSDNNNQLTLGSGSAIVSKCQTFTVQHDNNFNTSTPVLALNKNDENPQTDNPLGRFQWSTDNSNNVLVDFAYIEGMSDVVTNGSEEGSINFAVRDGAGSISKIHTTDKDGVLLETDKKIQFRQSDVFIHSNAANDIDISCPSTITLEAGRVNIVSSEEGVVTSPILTLDKVDTTPTNGAAIGSIEFSSNDSDSGNNQYAQLTTLSDVVTEGSQEASFVVRLADGSGSVNTITTTSKDGILLNTDKAVEFRSDAQYIKSDVAGSLEIGGASTTIKADTLTVESTQSGASSGATLILENDHDAVPGDNDLIGEIIFKGMDSAPNVQEFARIEVDSVDVSNTDRDGAIKFFAHVNGTNTEHMKITGNKVDIIDSRLKFTDTAAIAARGSNAGGGEKIAFECMPATGTASHTSETSVMALDDRTWMNAYGFMLSDNQGNGTFSVGTSNVVLERNAGAHKLYTNYIQARSSSTYFINLFTTGMSIQTAGDMRVRDNQYMGFGTSDDVKIFYDNDAISASIGELEIEMESTCQQIRMTDNETTRFTFVKSSGDFTATGNVTAYSDERLKSDIETLDPKKTLQMRGVEFTKDGKKGSGVIAQELEKIAPELVLNEGEYKSVAYGNLSGYLIETIKDQQKQIDELKTLVEKLMEKV